MGGGAAFSSQAGTAASLGSVEASSGRSTMEGQVEAGQAAARRAWKNATGHAWKGTQSTASAGETNHAEPPFVVPEGMDPNTCFELKIKLVGNRKKARKEVRCWSLEKFVDSDLINIKDLVESIVVLCPPGYLEVVHLQYYDNVMKTFPEVTCDQDLMSMFAKHKATKVVTMFIQYCDPSEPYVPITEWEIDEQMQQDNNTKLDDDDYLRNPLPENEHVGVDDEAMYLEDEAANPFFVVVYSEKEQDKDFVPEDDSEDGSEDEGVSDMEIDEDEELVGHEATHIPSFEYDKEDPPMTEGSTYRTMNEFKLALCTHAVKHEFELKTEKSSQHRFRAYCRRRDLDKCPWKLFASTTYDQCTVKVRKNRCGHECSSTRRKKKVKNATKHWICEKVKDFLIDDATLRARALQKKIKERYGVHIHYKRVYMGRILALNQLYGDWDTSFDNLYRFKAQIESCSPGSIVNIDHYTINGKIRFRRMFFALKPCIDGFLNGCRPYLAVDSTFLTGRFKGQLATASAVDGHNWLYPVCFGVFDSETNDNWNWFMTQLREAIGCPRGLAIHTDAGQAVMTGVAEVFPEAEKRECMFHLDYVHEFYSIDRFRAAYHELIPAMPDKSQWPKSTHGFHLYPPLLKATAGRPRTERYKGCSENKKKKGMHQCPICKDYGHHWHRCKKGNPEDIAAMMAIRGPPKKKAKTTKSAQSSIVPTEDDAPAASMSFPPSQTLETTCKKKRKHVTSGSGGSKCQSLETTSKTKENHDNSNSGPSKRSAGARWRHHRRRRRARRIILHVGRHLHIGVGLHGRPLELALLEGLAESRYFPETRCPSCITPCRCGRGARVPTPGVLSGACAHPPRERRVCHAAVLLEHTLVRLSGEDVMFAGVLPEHALVHVESGKDAMFAGVLQEHALVHVESGEDAMFTGVLPEHALVHVGSGEDAMFAGVLPEHALVHVGSGEDAMFAGMLPKHALVHVDSSEDAMIMGMLLENALVHLMSGEDAMHLFVTDQGVLLEHELPSWPTRARRWITVSSVCPVTARY